VEQKKLPHDWPEKVNGLLVEVEAYGAFSDCWPDAKDKILLVEEIKRLREINDSLLRTHESVIVVKNVSQADKLVLTTGKIFSRDQIENVTKQLDAAMASSRQVFIIDGIEAGYILEGVCNKAEVENV